MIAARIADSDPSVTAQTRTAARKIIDRFGSGRKCVMQLAERTAHETETAAAGEPEAQSGEFGHFPVPGDVPLLGFRSDHHMNGDFVGVPDDRFGK